MILAACVAWNVTSALAQVAAERQPAARPPLPQASMALRSPTDIFRELLNMSAAARQEFLAQKPAEHRQRLEAKIDEYAKLPVEEREARLQALEIRWHMLQLMQLSITNRAERLAAVPEQYRSLVRWRLAQWDILPPPLKKDVLDNEMVIRWFAQAGTSGRTQEELLAELPAAQREQLLRDIERWEAMPPQRKEQMSASFDRFFGLAPEDRNRTLGALPEEERIRMQAALTVFDRLPEEQRERVVEGFKKLNGLSPAERQEFLKSAERWRAMSEKDRELWRRIVARVRAAKLPPPPLPPQPTARIVPEILVATNR